MIERLPPILYGCGGGSRRPRERREPVFAVLAADILKALDAWSVYEAAILASEHGLDPHDPTVHTLWLDHLADLDDHSDVPVLFPTPYAPELDDAAQRGLYRRLYRELCAACSDLRPSAEFLIRIAGPRQVRDSLLRAADAILGGRDPRIVF